MSKSLDRVKEIMQLGWPALTVNGLMFGNILILQWHAGVQGGGGELPTGVWMKGARNFQILSSCFRNYITILSFKLKILFIVRSACFKSLHALSLIPKSPSKYRTLKIVANLFALSVHNHYTKDRCRNREAGGGGL